MSDTVGKIITTMLLVFVWCVLYLIFTSCNSNGLLSLCNIGVVRSKTRRDIYLVILYLMTFYILPYYILVNMWGLTKVFVVLMVFNLFGIISRFQ